VSAVDDASLTASLFAVDPSGLGGVCLRSLVQPARTQWLQILRDLLPPAVPLRRMPFNIGDGRLLGGLDLTATLRANRPIAERGVLAATDGGVVVVTMAERLSPHTAACLEAVLDRGEIVIDREGVQIRDTARVGVVALDESMADDERVPAGLLDRLALLVDLNGLDQRTPLLPLHDTEQIVAARELLPNVNVPPDLVSVLCGTAMALGAGSVRVSILAVKAARVLAALDGRAQVNDEDAVTAARLVFAPRATQVPQAESQPQSPPQSQAERDPAEDSGNTAEPPPPTPPESPPPQSTDAGSGDAVDSSEASNEQRKTPEADGPPLDELVLAATQAAIPAGLLHRLRVETAAGRGPAGAAGRVGALRKGGTRGRPSGVRSGPPRGHARLNVMETLRAAAPWQRLRGRVEAGEVRSRVRIDPSDFRVTQYQQRAQTLTIFAVDASGSSALNRLAEAKGAVELLLADCYVRRDQVAVVTFRGRKAELLLPPTRSLVRATRNLAGLPGGGGTPLAAAIDSALLVATQAQRRGDTPLLVLLTDGRANVARDGSGGREAAHRDALLAARQVRLARIATLFVDTSTRPNPLAETLASAMNAQYIALPYASAQALSRVVTAVASRAER
jgi:magnesium chelatase subunit D